MNRKHHMTAGCFFSRLLLVVLLLLTFFPLLVMINMSLKQSVMITNDFFGLPRFLYWQNYQKAFDFVIINAPLPDDVGTCFAIDICTIKQSAVLLLVKNDVHAGIHDKVAEYGVFTLPKPTSKPTMLHALNWMESARERLRQSEKKSLSIEEKMAEIRLVNKAKWILISELSMSEPEAHRYVEKQAMDRCISKRTIAEEIIKTYT